MRVLTSTLLVCLAACSAGESSVRSDDTADGSPGADVTAPADGSAADATADVPVDPDVQVEPDTAVTEDTTEPPPSPLAEAILEAMEAENIPGVAVALVRGEEVLHLGGYGLADVDEQIAVTPDTAFILASVSKTVIPMAALLAVDDGLLDLDADINSILPFAIKAPGFDDAVITTRMLLTHTSGISDHWDKLAELYVDGDSEIALGAVLENLLAATGEYYDAEASFTGAAPGTAYEYSNIGSALAAYVVESATGVPFDVMCEERLFAPLGMSHTSWHLADLEGVPLALPYAYVDGAYETYGHYGFPDYPNGALRSSVSDLSRLLRMMIGKGVFEGTSVLPEWAVDEMLTDLVPELEPGQGLAWYRYDDGEDLYWGHEGGDDGTATTLFFRPSDGVGVIVLANIDAPETEESWALYTIESLLYEAESSL